MSLSKTLCLRSDSQNSDSFSDCLVNKFESKEENFRRNSFCDRFCDDLCEEILQYLSLEDKLRLQCVSKQFQRNIFQKHYGLYINMSWGDKKNHKIYLGNQDFISRRDYTYFYCKDQSLDSFKGLLKKCPNITSIYLHSMTNKINEIFRLIIENCNNLSEVIVENHINDSNFEEFRRKFGPKIKYLRFFNKLNELSRFPNIEKLETGLLSNYSCIPHLKLDKLKKLEISIMRRTEFSLEHLLQTLIDTFPKLTHLKVSSHSEDENAIYKSLKNISNLKHLIHFNFHNGFERNNNKFYDLLKQMANICKNLKSIDCRIFIGRNSDITQLLSHLKAFPALKRLSLCVSLIFQKVDEQDIDYNQLFTFESFEGFSNITHLYIRFDIKPQNVSIFKGIDINLPKLQYLQIIPIIRITPEGVTQTADILSRLSRLETLKVWFITKVDLKPIEEQIRKKCRKIRKLQINRI